MKKDFKKKISKSALAMAVMLSVIGTGEAFADDVFWYGKSGNAWTTNQSSAATSGLTLTLTPSSTAESGSWADVNYFYGGYSAASATVSGNTLTINAGTYTSNNGASDFFAGFSDLGVVSGNILTLNSANFTTGIHLEAGNANGSGNVSGNIVNINNSTFGDNFEADGGQSSGLTSTTLNNAVNITGSTFNGTATICGSRAAFGNTTSGTVSVAGGIFSGDTEIRGNSSLKGTATNGKVEIKDSSKFTGQTTIYGSYTGDNGGAATGGKVTITGSEFNGNDTIIYGSYAESYTAGNATGGEVTVNGAYFHGDPFAAGDKVYIYGGMGPASASGNKVTINDISFSDIFDNCELSHLVMTSFLEVIKMFDIAILYPAPP